MPTVLDPFTLWATRSDSWSPKFRYARRYMSRSPSESSFWVVFGCGTHVPPPQACVNAATLNCCGPFSVELAGVGQSTWNFHSCRLLLAMAMTKFGEPPGGGDGPSTFDGNRVPMLPASLKHCCVAARPWSILVLSQAHTSGPVKFWPLAKMLYVT